MIRLSFRTAVTLSICKPNAKTKFQHPNKPKPLINQNIYFIWELVNSAPGRRKFPLYCDLPKYWEILPFRSIPIFKSVGGSAGSAAFFRSADSKLVKGETFQTPGLDSCDACSSLDAPSRKLVEIERNSASLRDEAKILPMEPDYRPLAALE